MGRGSFFTGEKKKKAKGDAAKPLSQAPVFSMPSVIKKGKQDY